jgi:hypothetical protein
MNEITIAPSDDRYIYVSRGPNIWGTRDGEPAGEA